MNSTPALLRSHWESLLKSALSAAKAVHLSENPRRFEPGPKNRFGEQSIKADLEMERAVIDVLKDSQLPIRVLSEEHGKIDLAPNPEFLAVLDGLDGSNLYKQLRGNGPSGTMLALYGGVAPHFGDYLACGVSQHGRGELLIATNGGGAYREVRGVRYSLRTSQQQALSSHSRVYVDRSYALNERIADSCFQPYQPLHIGASVAYYAALVRGEAALVIECTRKSNLEISCAYGLVREAGGAMFAVLRTENKVRPVELAELSPLSLGYSSLSSACPNVPIITAATFELGEAEARRISRHAR